METSTRCKTFRAIFAPVFLLAFMISFSVAAAEDITLTDFASLGPGGGGAVFCAVFHNTDSDIILAGQDVGGISKTTDGGASWHHVNRGLSLPDATADVYGITELIAHPVNNNVFFACTWGGLFRSDDTGDSWRRLIALDADGEGLAASWLAVSPLDTNLVLVGTGDWRSPDVGQGLYRSLDGGETFAPVAVTGLSETALIACLAFDPADGSVYAATSEGLLRSTDSGDSFSRLEFGFRHDAGQWIGIAEQGGVRTFWYVLQTLGEGSTSEDWSGGVYRSADGVTWTEIDDVPKIIYDEEILRAQGARIHTANPSVLYINLRATVGFVGGTYRYDGVWTELTATYPTDWNNSWLPDPEGLAVSPSDPGLLISCNAMALFKSEDEGSTWTQLSTRQVDGRWSGRGAEVTDFYDLEISQGVLYAAVEDVGNWRSDDRGASWKQLTFIEGTRDIDGGAEIYPHPGNSDRVYFGISTWSNSLREGNGSLIYKSVDGGDNMLDITPPAIDEGAGRATMAVVWGETAEQDLIYCAFHGDRLYRSSDGGATWSTSDNGIPDLDRQVIFRLTVDPENSQRVFAGLFTQDGTYNSSGGLYRSTDGGASWGRMTEYPFQDVYMAKFAGQPSRLFIGGKTYDTETGMSGGALLVSDDRATFSEVLGQPFVMDVIEAPGTTGGLYAAASATYVQGKNQDAGIYRSADNGNSWSKIEGYLPHTFVWDLAVFPDEPDRLLMATDGDGMVEARITGLEAPGPAMQNLLRVNPLSVAPGDSISVGIYYTSAQKIGELNFALNFDQSLLQAAKVEQVGPAAQLSLAESNLVEANQKGYLAISLTDQSGTSPLPISGGTIVEVEFATTVTVDSSLIISLSDVFSRSSAGDSLAFITENGKISFVTFVPGDVGGNGRVDIFDLLDLLKVLGGTSAATPSADVNNDGKTDIFDLLALLKIISGP